MTRTYTHLYSYTPTYFSFTDGLQTLDSANATIELLLGSGGLWEQIYDFSILVQSNTNPNAKIMAYAAYSHFMEADLGDGDSAGVPHNSGTLLMEPTPEPSSLLLLGTGALGATRIIRRRLL